MRFNNRIVTLFFITLIIILFQINIFFSNNVIAENALIKGNVYDEITDEPVQNASVILTYSENETRVTQAYTDSSGNFLLSNLSLNSYLIIIEAEGYNNKTIEIKIEEEKSYELNIYLEPILIQEGFSLNPLYIQIGIIFVIVLIISLIMYTKLKREDLLNNIIRRRIVDYLSENPGKHYRAIQSDLNLPMGVLSYHLSQLEKGYLISSKEDGKYRRYFIKGSENDITHHISKTQKSILEVIKDNQGISQSGIAERMGISRKVVNYHITILSQTGLIILKKRGRESTCYINHMNEGTIIVT